MLDFVIEKKDRSPKQNQDGWLHAKWRPVMAWQYTIICFFDFLLIPVYMLLSNNLTALGNWTPMTLKGAGLYHLAMGAIVGVYTLSRGYEKIFDMAMQGGYNPGNGRFPYPQMPHISTNVTMPQGIPQPIEIPTAPFRKTPP